MRIQELSAVFDDRYGRPYEAYARAPGRVNLIGEHIDYEGYSVLPMALQQECAVLLARGGEDIQLVTPDGSRHPNLTYAVDIHQVINRIPKRMSVASLRHGASTSWLPGKGSWKSLLLTLCQGDQVA